MVNFGITYLVTARLSKRKLSIKEAHYALAHHSDVHVTAGNEFASWDKCLS
jgi:hypothetical protein